MEMEMKNHTNAVNICKMHKCASELRFLVCDYPS